MAKKDQYFSISEDLFVNGFKTIAEIATQLKLAEKTIRNWKAEGEWDRKRAALVKSQTSYHQEVYEFARLLLKSIRDDLENGVKVDPGRMYAWGRLNDSIMKVKKYEDEIGKENVDDDKPRGMTPEQVAEARKMLGL